MRSKDTQTGTQSSVLEDCMFLMGNVSTYLSQGFYFIGQYKEMNQVKIKFQQFFDLR
jgi:hypothetical protein